MEYLLKTSRMPTVWLSRVSKLKQPINNFSEYLVYYYTIFVGSIIFQNTWSTIKLFVGIIFHKT